ncbi:putative anaerobic dimethylsulfoxide reductase [Photorhabdus temperata subsp. temperata M1021]|nr:putative anaerobic dimethylsulfoxide reductase [Photorhabdus temperata subsp. temperata M1021]
MVSRRRFVQASAALISVPFVSARTTVAEEKKKPRISAS